jgi:hypothetical protein
MDLIASLSAFSPEIQKIGIISQFLYSKIKNLEFQSKNLWIKKFEKTCEFFIPDLKRSTDLFSIRESG